MSKTQNYPSGYRFPPELNKWLTETAARMGMSKNQLLISILWRYRGETKQGTEVIA